MIWNPVVDEVDLVDFVDRLSFGEAAPSERDVGSAVFQEVAACVALGSL